MTRRLAAVPQAPPRAVLYLRQSAARDDSVSLELQETACRDHCARMGYAVVEVLSDPGITGRTWKRPAVVRTLDLVESGEADVVVLWKWSRLSRSRRDWAVAADRVDVAGGRIESATEAVDVTTSTGRLARGVLVEFAAFESERIGDVWREVHASRVAKGLAPTGKPKWGYAYDAAAKLHRPDPVTGPVLAECYRRYVAGESMYSLVGWLNGQGQRTLDVNPWSDRTLRRVMDSGFAAGLVPYRGALHPGAHEALIDVDLWSAYQAARRARRTSRRSERSPYLFSGMVRCSCGSSMQAGKYGASGIPRYRCKAGHDQRRHPGGYVSAAVLEDALLAWLHEVADEVDTAAAAQSLAVARRAGARSQAAGLAREVAALDEQLVRLTRQLAAGLVPEAAYAAARDEITSARDGLTARLQAAEDDAVAVVEDPAALARDLLREWGTLPVEHRRGMLKGLVARLVVTPGRPKSQVEVVPAWKARG